MDTPQDFLHPIRGGDAPPVRRGNGPLDRFSFPAHPTPRQIDDALAVVHSPGLVADQPALRLTAWETLMAERGHRVNTIRVSAMQSTLRDMRGLACHLLNPAGAA